MTQDNKKSGPPSGVYLEIQEDDRKVLASIAPCRAPQCPVVTGSPYYHSEVYDGRPVDASALKVPCMPVIPTYVTCDNVMIIGEYPTAKLSALPEQDQYFMPVADIYQPLEDTRYFDGYGIRNVTSGTIFSKSYLDPVGLTHEDLWITNMVKCFLFKQGYVNAYKEVGWFDKVPVENTYEYMKIAKICIAHVMKEIEACKPKLIITLGKDVCLIIQNSDETKVYDELVGVPLKANEQTNPNDGRQGIFLKNNIFHMVHPEGLMYSEPGSFWYKKHWDESIPALGKFLQDLGLKK